MGAFLEFLANLFYGAASNGANTTCLGPAYQPVEPDTLNELKKIK